MVVMKKRLFVLCMCLLSGHLIFAQGIVFLEGTLTEALTRAKQENKLVFVDVYTIWCGPCKMVAKTVFPQEKVGRYYNEHFINCKLDAEKGEGPEMVKKYGIEGYPTFLYLDGDGNLVYSFSGAKDAKGFLEEADKVGVSAKYGGWEKMQADYKAGKGDSDFLREYYELVSRDKKDEVLNRYLMSLPDDKLFTVEVGKMIENIKLYDYALLSRLVEGRVKLGKKDEDFEFSFTFPLQWKLTDLFNESIDRGDRKRFDEVMTLKNKFNALPDTRDPDVNLMWGRGLFFVSPELIDLCYYYKNRYTTDQFASLVPEYMENLMKKNPVDSLKERQQIIDMIRENPELAGFLGSNLHEQYNMMASNIIDWTEYYWRLVPSDKAHREQCATWVNYACRMNPYNPVIPIKAANLLIRLKHKKDALSHLESAIKAQQEIGGKDAKNLKMLQDELRDVKKGKEG